MTVTDGKGREINTICENRTASIAGKNGCPGRTPRTQNASPGHACRAGFSRLNNPDDRPRRTMVPGQTNDFTENPDSASTAPQPVTDDASAPACLMTHELIHHLIEALREELKQFGEMLVLLDHQQELVRSRQLPDLSPSAAAINAQA